MSGGQIPDYLEKLDENQRAAVSAGRNCVVTAGAGAGKTTVLAARYIHLVMREKLPVRSILALTFTRKAAAEMYERIYGVLAAQTSPWALEQLGDFQNAHITTIDSFCAEILRRASGDYGYSPAFSIDDEKTKDLARSIAYRYVLRNRGKPGLADMLKSFPFDDVASRLFGELGAKRVTPLALNEKLFIPMEKTLRAMVAEKIARMLSRLKALSEHIAALSANNAGPAVKADCAAAVVASASFIAAALKTAAPKATAPETASASAADAAPESLAAFSAHFLAFSSLAMRSYGRNELEQAIKEAAKEAKQKALDLLDLSEYQTVFPLHCALFERLDEFAAELAEAKRAADLVDFKDLGACAVDILRRRKDIRTFWKNAVASIMIDEFQDNNEQQKQLLYLLAEKRETEGEGIPSPPELEPGKLFFVGDEKQSIYRFRGADVAVFKKLADELTETVSGAPENIVLSSNYRSAAPLIAFFNDFFALAMAPSGDSDEEAFSARYADMTPGRPAGRDTENAFVSRVEYRLIEAPPEDEETREEEEDSAEDAMGDTAFAGTLSADESLAFEIAQFIKRERDVLRLRSGGGAADDSARRADYGDFAILLRTTTHQHLLEKYLRLLDIPFDAESPRSLFKESPANDIYNILSLGLDPENKAAYAATLRSPLCRISDDGFLRLMTSGRTDFTAEGLCGQDAAALERAQSFFSALRSFLASAGVAEVVEYVWNGAGLRIDILARPESHPFLEHFDYLYHIAAGVDQARGGVADFLEALRPYIAGETDKFEIANLPKSNGGGVQILTIHKSKGLQFPIVIIPWVETKSSAKRSQPLWHMLDEGLTVDIKPHDKPGAAADNLFFRLAKARENAKTAAEIKRLIYVACTRAEDHLFFYGKRPAKSDISGTSFQYYIEKYIATTASAAEKPLLTTSLIGLSSRDDVRRWHKKRITSQAGGFLPAYIRARAADRSFARRRLSVSEISAAAYRPEETLITGAPGTEPFGAHPGLSPPLSIPAEVFGLLCHDAMEKALAAGSAAGYKVPDEIARGLGEAETARAQELAAAMAETFLAGDFWRGLPPLAARQSEKSFLLALGDFIVEGRMDLFIETDGEIFVIDFKSDTAQDPEPHLVQLELYRRAAAGIAPGKEVSVGLYWLRSARFDWLKPSLSDESLAAFARRASGVARGPGFVGQAPL